ncbi:hypothetical protein K7I13_05280 [Brucepastera parasyntrophica]|uniref:hypothetical protein n=1 Tax=Brucepastera parasyntrophica TaxID=2880008 RepID=UPI00210A8869|nr:hypothetical protein [Brucepastera parasyntrophica]ULQ60686.1 hypothetical protein K7I13_05280 [Brucepastera parasyntrophica]
MTPKEYRLLNNHDYSQDMGEMGKIFTEWNDKKINGTNAVQMMKQCYDVGLEKIENKKSIEIQKKELKRCFDSLASYIKNRDSLDDKELFTTNSDSAPKTKDHSLVDSEELPDCYKHFFMVLLENTAPDAYNAMKKALDIKMVVYENGFYNFKCAKGCVGLIFSTAGYTEYKVINQHILINGNSPGKSTLKNGRNNTPPKEWNEIEKLLFSN